MELDQVLKTRKSIRSYEAGHTIDRETLEALIAAAQEAPTWKNSQTGRYYVVTTPEKIEEIRTEALPEGNAKKCDNAAALIITTFIKTRSGFTKEGVAENELGDGWGIYDLGLQNENLLLKAAELGLGTLVMGLRDGAVLRRILSIPDTEEVVAVISVGYPDNDPKKPPRKAVNDITAWF